MQKHDRRRVTERLVSVVRQPSAEPYVQAIMPIAGRTRLSVERCKKRIGDLIFKPGWAGGILNVQPVNLTSNAGEIAPGIHRDRASAPRTGMGSVNSLSGYYDTRLDDPG